MRHNSVYFNSFFSIPDAYQLVGVGRVCFENVNSENGNRFVIVPVSGVDKTVINAIQYAKFLADNITAVHVLLNPSDKDRIEYQWKMQNIDVSLIILESPNASIIGPLRDYVDSICLGNKGSVVTVVLPVIVTSQWWHRFLFNQTARLIEKALEGRAGVAAIRVPFPLTNTQYKKTRF